MVHAVVQRGPWGKTVDVLRLFARLAPAAHGACIVLVGVRAAGEIELNAAVVAAGAVAQAAPRAVLIEYAVPAVNVLAVRVLFGRVFIHGVDERLCRLIAVRDENARLRAAFAGADDERHFLDELAFGLAVRGRLFVPGNGGLRLFLNGCAVYKEQREPFGGEERIVGRFEHNGDGLICCCAHGAERERKQKREKKGGDFFHRGLLLVDRFFRMAHRSGACANYTMSGGGMQSVSLRRAAIWQSSRFVPNLALDKKRRKAYNAYVKSRKFELPKRFGACGGRDIECLKSMSRKTSLWMPL